MGNWINEKGLSQFLKFFRDGAEVTCSCRLF